MLPRPGLALCIVLAAMLPACKIVKNPDGTELATGDGAAGPGGTSTGAAEIWDTEVMAYLEGSATGFPALRTAIAADLDAAGATHGHRSNAEGSPWNFPVRLSGAIVAANTESRAATAEVDVDGDGAGDATIQLGPVIKGTTLRDVLPTIDFTAFRDQIEFAELARALNTRAYDATLAELPREDLVGRNVEILGAFTVKSAGDPILVTPVVLTPESGG
jgi:predicted lipoprotein